MSGRTKRKLLSEKNKGVCINGKLKLTPESSKIHSLVIGKTGAGKSTVFNIPNVLLSDGKTMVISDMDGGIFERTSGYLQSTGYQIFTFDLLDTAKSCFYNPIAFCQTNDDLKTLAGQIIVSGSSGGSKEKFWDNSATNLLFFLLKLVKTQEDIYQNLSNVRQLLMLLELDGFGNFVMQYASNELWLEYLSIKGQDSKLRSNISASLAAILDLISFDEIGFVTSKNTFDFSSLLQPKTVVYIIIPEHKISKYRLLVSIFYSQLFDFLQKNRPSHTVYCFMDEMAQYKLMDIEVLITIIRRYNVSLNFSIQDVKQLDFIYGDKIASTIFSNCSSKLIFPGTSLNLAQDLSKMSGTETVEVEFQQKSSQGHKPLITPREIIQMSKSESLFFHGNLPPLKLRTYPYYQNSLLKKRSELPVFVRDTNPYTKPPLIHISPSPNQTDFYDGFSSDIIE